MTSEFNFPKDAFGYIPGAVPAKMVYAQTQPSNPVEGLWWVQTAVSGAVENIYFYTGSQWLFFGMGSGSVVSETQPTNPREGMRWFNPTVPAIYVYYYDGDSGQWIEEMTQGVDGALRSDLVGSSSQVPVGSFKAGQLGNVAGNSDKKHVVLGCIPRCNNSGVFELVSDSAHSVLNVASVTQPDQYTIRVNYSETFSKINSFIAAPDAELQPFGLICGGDVGTSYANIQCSAPLNFIADNNSPTPSIVLNDLWAPSIGTASITATRVNASTLRVTHPPTSQNEVPVATPVNATNLFDFVVSYGPTQVDIICVGSANGFLSWSTTWSQTFSANSTAPTLTWTGSNTLKVDHGINYGGLVVPKVSPQGAVYTPRVVNYGSTFFEVAFYDNAGVKATTQNSNMQFWYELNLKVPCNWPTGNIVSVQCGLCKVPSYNFKGVVGNNLWVHGVFERT